MTNLTQTLKAGVATLALTSAVALPALASAQTAVPVAPPSASSQPDVDYPDYGPADGGDYGPDQGYDSYGPDGPPPPPQRSSNRPEDREYARKYAEWERQRADYDHYQYASCVKKQRGAAVAGAVIGGIAGAVLGSNIAPRWDRTGGAVAGGALGAVAGGAIGSTAGPVCPPGYGYGPGYAGPAYVGGPYYGGPVVVGAPVVGVGIGYGWGPRRYYRPYRPYYGHRGYWRRW